MASAAELFKALGANGEVGVMLVDRANHATFWPMVPAVVSGGIEMRHVAHSTRRILNPLGVEFVQAEVRGIYFEAPAVTTYAGAFPYEYLVLAPGSRTHDLISNVLKDDYLGVGFWQDHVRSRTAATHILKVDSEP